MALLPCLGVEVGRDLESDLPDFLSRIEEVDFSRASL